MYYDYSDGSVNDKQNSILEENWKMLAFYFEPEQNTGVVKAITLVQKNDVWFNTEEMYQYLKERYTVYERGTEETFKAFINNENFDKATVGITWNMESKVLMFQTITHNSSLPTIDYGRYMGKTRSEAKETMKSETGLQPASDTETSLIYKFDNEYIQAITLFFRSAETIQEVVVRLNPNINKSLVTDELVKNYTQIDAVENSLIIYQSNDNKMRVYYQISSNLIQYKWK